MRSRPCPSSLLEWCEQLHHLSVSPGGGPHECCDAILVCGVLVEQDDLGSLHVPSFESPVERYGFDYLSSSHGQGGSYCFYLTLLRSIHRRNPITSISPPHLSRCLLTSATSLRAAARMRAVSPYEEGLFTAGSALASILLRLAGPSSDIFCLIVINPQPRIVPMVHTPTYSSQTPRALCHLCFRK
ncbi:Chromosome segregation ATPase [Giardia duodenalis assemblage B]|uniref:Chromosome segregation ATPase n=1 Tax=Giardia duodenalis assemblage B TaxID=1394984 RepID=A0A132NLP2_GIAIN|nr:Chromosome segregation ATPase [Giardia intestinalis assemblage B]